MTFGMEYHGTASGDTIDQDKQGIGAGAVIYGEAGDDTITVSNALAIGGPGNDTIIGAGPFPTVAYWDSPSGVTVDLGNGTAQDGFGTVDKLVGIHVVQGSGHDDKLIGGAADEFFYGGAGSNTVIGGAGYDTVDYFFEKSTAAEVSYDAASDTFTVVKHFLNGDRGIDKLTGVEQIEFVGAGADGAVILRSQYVGDFRTGPVAARLSLPAGAYLSQFKQGDFNGDGHADFAFVTQVGTGTAPAPTFVLLGDGNGHLAEATAAVFGQVPMKIVGGGRTIVADFNNDGRSDVFQLDFGDDAPPFGGGQNSLYLSSKATGRLDDTSASLPRRNDTNHGGSAGDVNGDGYADVLANTLDKGDFLLLNDGTGHFTERADLIPHPAVTLGGVAYPESHTFSGIVDVNRDGAPDLVLGTWDGSPGTKVSKVLLNDGHGNFTHGAPILLPASGVDKEIVLDVKPIDLNGDGFADLMLSVTNGGERDAFYHTDYIQLLVNDGSGHFRDETAARLPQDKDTSSPGWFMALSAVDFNHDGFADILAESAGSPITSKVYLNRGDGTFALDWQSRPGERALAADVNGDGMPDLVAADSNGTIAIAINSLANGHVYHANFGGDRLLGSSAADRFVASTGAASFDGMGGADLAVFHGARAGYAVTALDAGFKVAGAGGSTTLLNVERASFDDAALAFDIGGVAGQAYRIYQAAFDRAPDAAGLGYWIGAMDHGMSLRDVAAGFVASAEFGDRYGRGQDNRAFLATLYHNVLHRDPDQGGIDYWGNSMEHGATRAEVLAQFSESNENQLQVIGAIRNGIDYLPYH